MPSSSTILPVSQQVQNLIIKTNKTKNIIYLQLRMENFDQLYYLFWTIYFHLEKNPWGIFTMGCGFLCILHEGKLRPVLGYTYININPNQKCKQMDQLKD